MNLTRPALGACLLLLAGCASVAQPVFPRHYALIASVAQTGGPTSSGRGTLQLARIDAPPWLQGTGMYYRLDYQHDDRIDAYTRSDWVAPPARMLEPMVRAALAGAGIWRMVVGPGTPANADANLHIRLDDFSQVFAGSQQSHAVLDATATLIDARDGDAIAQKRFHVKVAAPSANAAGGAAALNLAAGEFTAQLQRWLRAVPWRSGRAPS